MFVISYIVHFLLCLGVHVCFVWPHRCELWMGLLLDNGGFSEYELGLVLLCGPVVSSGGLGLHVDVGWSPPATADLATDST